MPDLHDFGNSMNNVILQASFDGRLKSDEGFQSGTGDLCTLTAGSGKDLYLTGGKLIAYSNTGSSAGAIGDEIVCKVNGVIVETVKISWFSNGANGGIVSFPYELRNLFHKVESGEILKLEVITLDADTDIEGFIQAIEVPKGENPLEYRGE